MAGLFDDGVTNINEAALNKGLVGDTYNNGFYMAVSYRVLYDGANWVVSTAHGSKQSAGALAPVWNAGDNRLDITLTLTRPFTDIPTAMAQALAASAHASQPRYTPHANATSTTAIVVRFIDLTAPTDYVTVVGTKMAFWLTLYGPIN